MGIPSSDPTASTSSQSDPRQRRSSRRSPKPPEIDRVTPAWVYPVRLIISIVGLSTIAGTVISIINPPKTSVSPPVKSPPPTQSTQPPVINPAPTNSSSP